MPTPNTSPNQKRLIQEALLDIEGYLSWYATKYAERRRFPELSSRAASGAQNSFDSNLEKIKTTTRLRALAVLRLSATRSCSPRLETRVGSSISPTYILSEYTRAFDPIPRSASAPIPVPVTAANILAIENKLVQLKETYVHLAAATDNEAYTDNEADEDRELAELDARAEAFRAIATPDLQVAFAENIEGMLLRIAETKPANAGFANLADEVILILAHIHKEISLQKDAYLFSDAPQGFLDHYKLLKNIFNLDSSNLLGDFNTPNRKHRKPLLKILNNLMTVIEEATAAATATKRPSWMTALWDLAREASINPATEKEVNNVISITRQSICF